MSALASLALLGWAATSSAAPAQRVLLEEGGRTAVAARLKAELNTLGYEVVSAATEDTAARVRIADDGVEVWIDGQQRERVEGSDDGLLAIKSVELLRAYLHELSAPRSPEVPPSAPAAVLVEPSPPGPRFRLELGPRAAFSPGAGVFPELLLRARLAEGARLSVGLDVQIPTLPARISAAEGSATLSFGAALAAADLSFAPSEEDRLRLGGGLGPLLLWMDGSAAPGFRGQAETLAALATELRLAYGRRLGPLWLWVELSGLLAFPRPVVRFAGRTIADFGRPLIGGALLLELPL